MKKFFTEFKKFITRGNVVDMAVGIIVGGAFTAIVNGVSNFVLKPLTNWLLALVFSKDSLTDLYTVLTPAYQTDDTGAFILNDAGEKVLDLANSIYLDWGSLINAVINFFLTAFVLFVIVKLLNKLREEHDEMAEKVRDYTPTKAERKEMRAKGIKLSDLDAVKAFLDEKDREAEEAAAKAKAEADAKAAAERAANPTAEDLLKEIRDLLKKEQ